MPRLNTSAPVQYGHNRSPIGNHGGILASCRVLAERTRVHPFSVLLICYLADVQFLPGLPKEKKQERKKKEIRGLDQMQFREISLSKNTSQPHGCRARTLPTK